MVAEVADRDAAESIIVIPGGLEEKAGGDVLAGRMRAALEASRLRLGGGPLANGGNCLGIRSRPGRYDTFFIPGAKLAPPSGHPAPLAIVAQSGAFAISRMSRLRDLDAKYVITVGNQMDLTIGDHLEHLAADPEIRVFGVYVEGFAPLDGRRFVAAARAIAARGGVVVLYRAGRTTAGASASASHTAAIAGDALVTEQLARQAGVIVAGSLEAFDDLVRTLVLFDGRTIAGGRLAAVSNAGFECVAIADNLGSLQPARFGAATERRLAKILGGAGLTEVIDIHNPFDLTPMGDDATFASVAEAILDDDGVDIGVVGDVPFTAALQTLPGGAGGGEDLAAPGSIAPRLVDLWRRTSKAWVAVVDAGPRYDPLARALEAGGIPTFRTADAALRTLEAVVERRIVEG
jgi:acyl-CoA synthetase (NDP forming)